MKNIKNNKIVPYRKKKQFNFVAAVFGLILIYMLVQFRNWNHTGTYPTYIIPSLEEFNPAVYYRGIISRDETIVTTSGKGYVNYAIREGKKASAHSIVYTTDASGEFSSVLAESYQDGNILPTDILSDIKQRLTASSLRAADGDFSSVVSDKKEIGSFVADSFFYTALSQLQNHETINREKSVSTDISGYIVFYEDSLNGLTPDQITSDSFNENDNKTIVYPSGVIRDSGDFAYKIIPSDSFTVTFPVTEEDEIRFKNSAVLTVDLKDPDITVTGDLKLFIAEDGTHLASVSFSHYGSSFLNRRFVSFEITNSSVNGYKIPVSSVTSKEFLMIPKAFLSHDEDTGAIKGVRKEVNVSGSAEDRIEEVTIAKYAENKDYCYISSSKLSSGDYLVGSDGTSRYLLSISAPLTGVYNVNRGYCIFRQVDIIDKTADGNYYMIKKGTKYGVNAFDHIIADAELVKEGQIIERRY